MFEQYDRETGDEWSKALRMLDDYIPGATREQLANVLAEYWDDYDPKAAVVKVFKDRSLGRYLSPPVIAVAELSYLVPMAPTEQISKALYRNWNRNNIPESVRKARRELVESTTENWR